MHCAGGINRSPFVVIYWLLRYRTRKPLPPPYAPPLTTNEVHAQPARRRRARPSGAPSDAARGAVAQMVSVSGACTAQVWARVCVKRQAAFGAEHPNAVLVGVAAWAEKLQRRLDAERGRHKDDSHPCAHLNTLRCDVRTALYVPPPATAAAASTSTSSRTRPPSAREGADAVTHVPRSCARTPDADAPLPLLVEYNCGGLPGSPILSDEDAG